MVLTDEVRNDESIKNFKTENNKLSPAVRRVVTEKKIDVNKVKGTGKDGRILKGDVIKSIDGKLIKDIYEYMDRLSSLKKDMTVPITVERDGKVLTLSVTF